MSSKLKYLYLIVIVLCMGVSFTSCTESTTDDPQIDVPVVELEHEKLIGAWSATLMEFLYENGYKESITEEEIISDKLGVWSLVEVTKEEIKPVGSEELYGYQITGKSINVKGEDFSVDVTVVSVNDKILVVSYIHPNGCNWQITYIKTTLNDDKEDEICRKQLMM